MRRAVAIAAGLVMLSGCGGTAKPRPTTSGVRSTTASPPPSTSPTTAGNTCPFNISLRAPNHHPVANRDWTITVALHPSTLVGKPYYQFLFNGATVVSTQYVNGNRNFTFRGHYTDPQKFPSTSVGYQLTFRVVVATRCGTKHADYPIMVRQ